MDSFRKISCPFDLPAQRLDSYLSEQLPEISRSQLKKLVEDGRVSIDGHAVKASYKLRGGEQITVALPQPQETSAVAEEIPLDIYHEDQDLIVINKPAGMVVHPAAGHWQGTLVNALLYHCHDLAGIGGELRPGIVHRIDKDTSGLLVAAKNDISHQHLAAQFKQHSITRRYLALVHGIVDQQRGTIDQEIGRHPQQRKKMSVNTRQGRRAVTHWKLLKRYDKVNLSLVECALETGRTHQIRVHFSAAHHPLIADPLYGSRSREAAVKDLPLKRLIATLPGQALHAFKLGFIHPTTGKYLEFSCQMPDTLSRIIDYLDQTHQN